MQRVDKSTVDPPQPFLCLKAQLKIIRQTKFVRSGPPGELLRETALGDQQHASQIVLSNGYSDRADNVVSM